MQPDKVAGGARFKEEYTERTKPPDQNGSLEFIVHQNLFVTAFYGQSSISNNLTSYCN